MAESLAGFTPRALAFRDRAVHTTTIDPRALRRRARELRARRRAAGSRRATSCGSSRTSRAKPLYVELHRAVWRAGGHTIGHYLPDDDAAIQPLARLPRARGRRASSTSSRRQQARGLMDQMDHQVSVLERRRHARARGGGPAQDHAQREGNEAAARLAHGEGERGALHVDARRSTGHPRWRRRRASRRRSTGSRSSRLASSTRRTRSRAGGR